MRSPSHRLRYLVAHLPGFRLERCGWGLEEEVVLSGESRGTARVLASSAALSAKGIRPGMALSEARALAPALEVEWLDEEGELRDLAELALQLRRVSPAVEPLHPAAVAAELLAGSERSERGEIRRVEERLCELGHVARVVVADDLQGARLLAEWGRGGRVVRPGGLSEALAPLPIEALRLRPGAVQRLVGLGVHSLGDLAALPAASVAARFGEEGARAHRVARGEVLSGPLPREEGGELLSVSHELPAPVEEREALLFVLNRMCREMMEALDNEGLGLVRLGLDLELDGGAVARSALRSGRPVRALPVISRMVRRHVEDLRLDAPVLGATLRALETGRWSPAQERIWRHDGSRARHGKEEVDDLPHVVARLVEALGSEAVWSPAPVSSWRPEDAWRPAATALGDCEAPAWDALPGGRKEGRREPDPAWHHDGWWHMLPGQQPALLLQEPRPVEVELESGGETPRRLRLEGRWFRVRQVVQEERLSGEWWDDGFQRNIWTLDLDDGRRIWLYRERGHFLLHGFHDQG